MKTPTNRKRRGRGEGSVYQRADGWWVGSVSLGLTPTGKRRRKVVYGATKAEAQAEMRKVQHSADRGTLPLDRSELTVGTWFAHWLKVIAPTVEPATLFPYRRHGERFIVPKIGHVKLAQLRRSLCQGLYGDLLDDGVSAAMVRKIATTLVASLNAAVQAGELPANPAARLKKPKAERRPVPVLTPEQAAALARACDGARLGAMFLLMLDAGTGPGETFALTWGDLDLGRRTVSVTKSLEEISGKCRVKATKTKHRNRTVTISAGTAAALASHRDRLKAEGKSVAKDSLAFSGSRMGGFLRSTDVRERDWLPVLQAAGIPNINLYALRHTCATLLLLAGVNPKVVAERLGHCSVNMTLNVYSHVLPSMQQQAADVMGKWLNPPATPISEIGYTQATPDPRDDKRPARPGRRKSLHNQE